MKKDLKQINEETLGCQKCALAKTRTNVVVGEGNPRADIMFVGEAPGANEDKHGRPFCGRAGEVLTELLARVGLNREDIFIGNILKCRPPGNRNPLQDEIKACGPYLDEQIRLIKPKILCCLGNFSTKYIMTKAGLAEHIQGISKIRGQIFTHKAFFGSIKIIPLYHPAVVTYNMNMKSVLEKDFDLLKQLLSEKPA